MTLINIFTMKGKYIKPNRNNGTGTIDFEIGTHVVKLKPRGAKYFEFQYKDDELYDVAVYDDNTCHIKYNKPRTEKKAIFFHDIMHQNMVINKLYNESVLSLDIVFASTTDNLKLIHARDEGFGDDIKMSHRNCIELVITGEIDYNIKHDNLSINDVFKNKALELMNVVKRLVEINDRHVPNVHKYEMNIDVNDTHYTWFSYSDLDEFELDMCNDIMRNDMEGNKFFGQKENVINIDKLLGFKL